MIDLSSREVRWLLLAALVVGAFFGLAGAEWAVVPRW